MELKCAGLAQVKSRQLLAVSKSSLKRAQIEVWIWRSAAGWFVADSLSFAGRGASATDIHFNRLTAEVRSAGNIKHVGEN